MTDQRAGEEPHKRHLATRLLEWILSNVKVAAAFIGGMSTAVVLVFNAGRDYQELKSQEQANTAEIQTLRREVWQLERSIARSERVQP